MKKKRIYKTLENDFPNQMLNEPQQGFMINLETGEATRSIFEMSPEEIGDVARQIFQIAKDKAAQVGQQPIVS